MEVVSHATPPHLVNVKINFDEVQKLTWKEIKFLYGLIIIKIINNNNKKITNKNNKIILKIIKIIIKIITSNHISELLKVQLESRSQNVLT